MVFEDLQWADEATLDLLRFVGRRLDGLSCLVVGTHRADLVPHHPLRRVSAALVGPLVTRMQLPPLSVDAVRDLCEGSGLDPVALHVRTGGNPFFVVELLGGEPGSLPATVRDTILARASLLGGAARDALDAAAVLGRHARAELIQAVGDCDASAIDACVLAGLLVDDQGLQRFRHDLSRQAIEEALTPLRRRQLHTRAFEALGHDGDVVQRAHHAIGGGDDAIIVDCARTAADHCVALGTFREAAALYGSALDHAAWPRPGRAAGAAGAPVRSPVSGSSSSRRRSSPAKRCSTCWAPRPTSGRWGGGSAGSVACTAASGDRTTPGGGCGARWPGSNRWGSRPSWQRALAMLTQQQMLTGQESDAVANGLRARAMAERFGVEEVAVHAMDSYGAAMACGGDDAGLAVLHEALDQAKRAGIHHEVARICINLADTLLDRYEPTTALADLGLGVAVVAEHELWFNRNCLLGERAKALLLLGRWDEAVADIHTVLEESDLSDSNRSCALLYLGRIRARRGDPGRVPGAGRGTGPGPALRRAADDPPDADRPGRGGVAGG